MERLPRDCMWQILDWLAPQVLILRRVNRQWSRWVLAYYNARGYWASEKGLGVFENLRLNNMKSLCYSKNNFEIVGQLIRPRRMRLFRMAARSLPLRRMEVQKLKEEWIPYLPNLTSVKILLYEGNVLALNQLSHLTKACLPDKCLLGVVGRSTLRELKLIGTYGSMNGYSSVECLAEDLLRLTQLTSLSMSTYEEITDELIASLSQLQRLTLYQNRGAFRGSGFQSMSRLEYFKLKGKRVEHFNAQYLLCLPSLRDLRMDQGQISPEVGQQLTQLTRLHLSPITSDNDFLTRLTQLQDLRFFYQYRRDLYCQTRLLVNLTSLEITAPPNQLSLIHLRSLHTLKIFWRDQIDLSRLSSLRVLQCPEITDLSYLPPNLSCLKLQYITPEIQAALRVLPQLILVIH